MSFFPRFPFVTISSMTMKHTDPQLNANKMSYMSKVRLGRAFEDNYSGDNLNPHHPVCFFSMISFSDILLLNSEWRFFRYL